ncbi:DUF1156 domain-containing protein [Mesorhizobium sp. M0751]|uniref:DUF1156 domain-containing protein n=1 Tax=unclassified Mesorhizobium TaxID=325217 RepID=UPI00333713DB
MMEDERISDVRLIERWLPIAEIGIESLRERTPMTPFPAPNRLHVWWARRPLVASRAAVLASLLPADADHERFLHALGIHGDPLAAKRRIAAANRTGERLGKDAYGYPRAFTYRASSEELSFLGATASAVVLDPTAGGGAIPFESMRLGFQAIANDLNPVASAILSATIDFPQRLGNALVEDFEAVGATFRNRIQDTFTEAFPSEPILHTRPDAYLWARTIECPYCRGQIPLSPNWRLNAAGLGVRLVFEKAAGPGSAGRFCSFEIVDKVADHSEGTVADGDATCPFPDCARVVNGDEVKRQAQSQGMGDQLFAVVYKRRVETKLRSGAVGKPKWERGYRAPLSEDDNAAGISERLAQRLSDWEALGIVPIEPIDEISNYDRGHRLYGMTQWRDLFSPRQLLGHCLAVEVFRGMVEEDRVAGLLTDIRRAAYIYLSFSLDKLRDYNSRMTRWIVKREVMANTFDSHNFSMKWSYVEMAIMVEGQGFDWAIRETRKCIKELVDLSGPVPHKAGPLFGNGKPLAAPIVMVSSKSGASLDHLADSSVDAVVMDPPYGSNVMYAELSDFFYVWLKRTAGLVAPELFTRRLTDKASEAVANKAHFKGHKGADALANRDYQEKMAAIFAESRRVLKPNGIMTVMFTHKDTSAWDALTKGLIEAGFIITASWPVNTEAEGSLHIKDKAAANSTIFLVCRPRPAEQGDGTTYWEDVEPLVAKAVRTRVEQFQKAGISGVDLYLASFGPALEEFSRHWPLKRGTPRPEPLAKKRRKQAELFEEEFDPYAVTPEDALDAARREVKTWRLNQLTHTKGRGDLDATTSWFVLAWDAFKAPVFSYDEGLRLARAVGADLDGQLIGRICEKKGSDIKLWDSATRAAKNALGPVDGSRAMIDAIHHAAHRGRTRTLEAAVDLLKDAGIDGDPQFLAALEAVLEVLPPSRNFVGFDVATGDAKSAADDFDALEKLRRLAFSDKVDEPQQLSLFTEEAA